MILKCAWCGRTIKQTPPYKDRKVTHGICKKCFKEHFGKLKEAPHQNLTLRQ